MITSAPTILVEPSCPYFSLGETTQAKTSYSGLVPTPTRAIDNLSISPSFGDIDQILTRYWEGRVSSVLRSHLNIFLFRE